MAKYEQSQGDASDPPWTARMTNRFAEFSSQLDDEVKVESASAFTVKEVKVLKSALKRHDPNIERNKIIEDLVPKFNDVPDIRTQELDEGCDITIQTYSGLGRSENPRECPPPHYPSWMSLLEAWRCAKKLSEEVHGVLSCPCLIGYPLVVNPNEAFWFDPGLDKNVKEGHGEIYLKDTRPTHLKVNEVYSTLKKYSRRATRFTGPSEAPFVGVREDINYVQRACECDFITTQAR